MPLSSVLDVLGKASKNVAILMNKKIQTAPVFIKQIVRSEDNGQGANDLNPVNNSDPNLYKNIDLVNIIKVYEIWQVFLEYGSGKDSLYIVISGDFKQKGYKNGTWDNFDYEGFYSSVQEAENEIKSHAK